jgi:prevent-host-death family protein
MHITNITEAKANLSHLIKLVRETNQAVIIGKAGKPVAVLSPYSADTAPRELGGSWEGRVKLHEDFDASDSAIGDSFYQSDLFPGER